ncbi:ATP phosphoribosyltransferase [Clavibacter tessellarius]|uniref:ATP phosphoribosyltransferase n=1 Tax=Clavibacter tessellarius TaxID=31965 RepID=UPI00324BC0F5
MLRVAVPNKGSLAETAAQMLAEAGYAGRRDPKELYVLDARNDVEFFYLRPRDIATYVGSGALDVGITGRDLLIDSASEAAETAEPRLRGIHVPLRGPRRPVLRPGRPRGVRIATSYPVLVGGFLREHGVEAQLIRLDGAVESAIQLGVADAIADVVETGTTLRKAGLEIFGPVILRSTAVLISGAEEKPGAATLLRRLEGVLVARRYVLMDYDVPLDLLDAATAITPGIESPTISPLQDPAWVAVRSMVPRDDTNQIMDRLHEVGARAILVSPIHAARI